MPIIIVHLYRRSRNVSPDLSDILKHTHLLVIQDFRTFYQSELNKIINKYKNICRGLLLQNEYVYTGFKKICRLTMLLKS